jgi:hypothetical protein
VEGRRRGNGVLQRGGALLQLIHAFHTQQIDINSYGENESAISWRHSAAVPLNRM